MAEQKNVFFVGIQEPIQFRREILSCSKDVIGVLKRFEQFKQFRKEKAEIAAKLRRLFEEISFLNNKLRQELPKTKLRALRQPVELGTQEIVLPRILTKVHLSTVDKLEQELLELEAKLERLK